MGRASHGPALDAHDGTSEGEALFRSSRVNLGTTLAAGVLAMAPFVPEARGTAAFVVVAAWLVFEATLLAFRRLGEEHPAYRVLSPLDAACQHGAVLAQVFLHGSASTPLWLFVFAKAFVWHPRRRERLRTDLVVMVAAHAALGATWVALGRPADAAFSVLALLASTIAYTTSARAVLRGAQMKAERDRLERALGDTSIERSRAAMAREIHDGVAAELTALLLRLRRDARRRAEPDASALADRAQDILHELRGVVWSLRNEQGTLSELAKLADVTCRRIAAPASYVRAPLEAAGATTIGPRAAVEALEAARTLVGHAAREPGVTRIELSLSVTDVLTVAVRHDPPSVKHAVSIALGHGTSVGLGRRGPAP